MITNDHIDAITARLVAVVPSPENVTVSVSETGQVRLAGLPGIAPLSWSTREGGFSQIRLLVAYITWRGYPALLEVEQTIGIDNYLQEGLRFLICDCCHERPVAGVLLHCYPGGTPSGRLTRVCANCGTRIAEESREDDGGDEPDEYLPASQVAELERGGAPFIYIDHFLDQMMRRAAAAIAAGEQPPVSFMFNGQAIADPLSDVSGRHRVDPYLYYGEAYARSPFAAAQRLGEEAEQEAVREPQKRAEDLHRATSLLGNLLSDTATAAAARVVASIAEQAMGLLSLLNERSPEAATADLWLALVARPQRLRLTFPLYHLDGAPRFFADVTVGDEVWTKIHACDPRMVEPGSAEILPGEGLAATTLSHTRDQVQITLFANRDGMPSAYGDPAFWLAGDEQTHRAPVVLVPAQLGGRGATLTDDELRTRARAVLEEFAGDVEAIGVERLLRYGDGVTTSDAHYEPDPSWCDLAVTYEHARTFMIDVRRQPAIERPADVTEALKLVTHLVDEIARKGGVDAIGDGGYGIDDGRGGSTWPRLAAIYRATQNFLRRIQP